MDLGLALRFGCKPVFFRDTISWDAYVAHNEVDRAKKAVVHDDAVPQFVHTLDSKLVNVWKDLKEFSRLANLAAQTSYKLPPNRFSEIMVSILYRLLSLSFTNSPIEEAIRLGAMTYAAAVFFRWRTMRQRQGYLDRVFQSALTAMRKSPVPPQITFWLLVVWYTCTSEDLDRDFLTAWLDEIMVQLGVNKKEQARQILKSVMWIDCLFDASIDVVLSRARAKKQLSYTLTCSDTPG